MSFTLRENVSVVVVTVVVDAYESELGDPRKLAFDALPRIPNDIVLLRSVFESTRYVKAGFQFLEPIRGKDAFEVGRSLKAARDVLAASSQPLSVLVFWSGHALTVGNELRLVTQECFEPMTRSDGFAPSDLAGNMADAGLHGVYLVLDVCQAASAAPEVFTAVARRSVERPIDNSLSMATLFASYPRQLAADGAFVECLARLLDLGPSPDAKQRMRDSGRFPINENNRVVTMAEVAEALRFELDVLPAGRRKSHPWVITSNDQPLFPSPVYVRDARPDVVDHIRRVARRADLDTHFLPKARGLEPGEPGWFFAGRRRLSAEIVRWLNGQGEQAQHRLFVLAGDGGSGKSALIGRLVALSDPAARALAREQGWRAESDLRDGTVPDLGRIDAALNLRGLSNEQVMQALAELLEITAPGEAVDPSAFVASMPTTSGQDAHPTTLVLDALDEATDPARLATSLIASMARRGIRVLVATRPVAERGDRIDLITLLAPDLLRGLDELDDMRTDIVEYVVDRLSGSPLHASSGVLADFVASHADGTFLFARMATTALLRAGLDVLSGSLEDRIGAGVGDALQRELREMDRAFQSRFDRVDAGASALFAALAWSQGTGIPLRDELWSQVATAIAGLNLPLRDEHARWMLLEGGRYIVEAGDGEQATYRLYHQTLVDELRKGASTSRAQKAIVSTLISHARMAGGWSRANAYAVRHTVSHLASAVSSEEVASSMAAPFESVVCNFGWMRAKLALDGPYVLLDDLVRAMAADARGTAVPQVERALRQSAAVLAADPHQLPSQLIGRLLDQEGEALHALLRDARAQSEGPWLRPVKASLADEASRRWMRPTPSETLNGIAFSDDGRWAVHYGFHAQGVSLWDLRSWQQVGLMFRTQESVNALAITDDARHVLYPQGSKLFRWSATGEVVCLADAHPDLTGPTRLHISPDGRYALSGTSDGSSVVAWDFGTGRHEILAEPKRRDIACIALARSGLDAVVVRDSGDASLIRLWPVRVVKSFQYTNAPSLLSRSADGLLLLAVDNSGRGDLRHLARPDRPLVQFKVDGAPRSLVLSADGTTAAIGTADGSIDVCRFVTNGDGGASDVRRTEWSAAYRGGQTYEVGALAFGGGRLLSADLIHIKEWEREQPAGASVPAAAISFPRARMNADAGVTLARDASVAYVLCDSGLVAWNLENVTPRLVVRGLPETSWRTTPLAMSNARSPRLMSWTPEAIQVFDTAIRREHAHRPDDRIESVAMFPDGKSVAYAASRTLWRWTVDGGKIERIDDMFGSCRAIACSPDGRQVVACVEGDVIAWSLAKRVDEDRCEELTRAPIASRFASKMLFSAARLVLIADDAGHLFSVDTQRRGFQQARQLEGKHPSDISALLCTRDGRYALTSSTFSGTSVWDVAEGRLLRHLDVSGTALRMSEPFGHALLSTRDGVLTVFSLESGTVIAAFQADRQVVAGDADDALRWIVGCDQGGQMHVLRLEV